MEDNLPVKAVEVTALLPFAKTGVAAALRRAGALLGGIHRRGAFAPRARVEPRELALLEPFLTEDGSV